MWQGEQNRCIFQCYLPILIAWCHQCNSLQTPSCLCYCPLNSNLSFQHGRSTGLRVWVWHSPANTLQQVLFGLEQQPSVLSWMYKDSIPWPPPSPAASLLVTHLPPCWGFTSPLWNNTSSCLYFCSLCLISFISVTKMINYYSSFKSQIRHYFFSKSALDQTSFPSLDLRAPLWESYIPLCVLFYGWNNMLNMWNNNNLFGRYCLPCIITVLLSLTLVSHFILCI